MLSMFRSNKIKSVVCEYLLKNKLRFPKKGISSTYVECKGQVDNEKVKKIENDVKHLNINSFTVRTHNCEQLRHHNVKEVVTLCGWLEFRRMGMFIILRDGYGKTQFLIPPENKLLQDQLDKTPYESILQITGVVALRPKDAVQSEMSTGEIEVVIQDLKVLNKAKELPFTLREHNKPKEALRMQYRYLDLRFAEMQRNLRVRSNVLMKMREFLVHQAAFVDVETPTLFRATPGGAQEFVVPTKFPGLFYSLAQSPQQFKQLLMAGSIDRYFQIARCYRDESARSDRQPEFTQLDIEMSFTNREGIMELVEKLLQHCWPKFLPEIEIPFKRMNCEDALEIYGSDKPDISFNNTLINCTDIIKQNSNLVKNSSDFDARVLLFRKPFITDLTKRLKIRYSAQETTAHRGTKLIQHKFTNNLSINNWKSIISKLLGATATNNLIDFLQLDDECVLFLAYGKKIDVCTLLGKIRVDFVNHLEEIGINVRVKKNMTPFWIVDFPLFELNNQEVLSCVHHPFTAPYLEDLELLRSNPLKVRSQSYDLVLNGNEIAGGSMRIHDCELQKEILNLLKIPQNSMQHMLEALASGCPPHGGIALGLDRLMSIFLNTKSIRDVIAFPKGIEGRDLLSGAPIAISKEEQKLYHLKADENEFSTVHSFI